MTMNAMTCARVLTMAVLAGLFAACGGGGSGGGDDEPSPFVEVVFPPLRCNVEDGSVRVRGVSTGVANVMSVDVGGVAASSVDGFNTWFATVPLSFGLNQLTVTARDDQGDQDPDAFTLRITRSIQLGPISSIDYDAAGNRVVMLQVSAKRLVTKDLATGAVRILSGDGVGTGVAFANPRHVVFDTARNRAIVSDQTVDDLITVDLTTGNRAKLTNTFFNSPDAMVLDAAGNRVLVTDTTIDAVVAVNLTTGARTTLSDDLTGTGEEFSLPNSIDYDAATNTAYVLDASLQAILAVNLANGDRTIVADRDTGTGGPMNSSTSITLAPGEDEILLVRGGFHRIEEVDIATGDRTILVSETGNGPPLEGPNHVIFRTGSQVLVSEGGGSVSLLQVNLNNDARTVVHDWRQGQGPIFEFVRGVAFDAERRRILAADDRLDALLAIDARTGNRSFFIQGQQPNGNFQRPERVRVDPDRDVAYVYGINPIQLVCVDLDTGFMDVVSRMNDVGAGETFQGVRDIEYDPLGQRYFASRSQPDVILDVDDASGDRTIFADATTGTGTPVSSVASLALDATNNRLYYRQSNGGALVNVVNIATGVRTSVTDNNNTGPTTSGAQDMRLDLARNRLVVFSGFDAEVVSLDLTSGDRQELSGPNVGGGVPAAGLYVGDIDRDLNLAACYDTSFRAIVIVDLSNGARATLSR